MQISTLMGCDYVATIATLRMLAEYRGFLPVHERFKGMSFCGEIF
jgi:hypothetical protein